RFKTSMTERFALKPLNDRHKMHHSNSGEIRSLLRLLKHVDDRDSKRDVAQTANELRKILSNASTFEELEVEWTEVAVPLRLMVCHNSLPAESRKAASGALAALGILSLGYFDRFIDLINDCWKEVPSRKEDRRVFILHSLTTTLNSVYERQCFFPQSTLEKLCSTTMSFLDSNNSVMVLTPAMELALVVSTITPRHLFIKNYFQDTVDVAIGWLVEEGQDGLTSAKLERTKEILLAFLPFWSEKMDLLNNLSKQFLEDMNTNLEDAKRELEAESLIRIKAIAGTLLLLIKICGEIRTPAAALVVKFVSDEVSVLVKDRSILVYISSEKIASIYSIYMEILSRCVPFQTDEVNMEILNGLVELGMTQLSSSHILLGLFRFLTKIASENRESISIPMCSSIFGSSSLLSSIDFSLLPSSVLTSFCHLISTLLNPSILSVLQLAYSEVVAMLKESLSRLLDTNETMEKHRINDEIRITAIVYALKPILILKNSLIVMLGLSPSLLDLVLLDSHLLDSNLQSSFPAIHYTLLHAAYDHCKAHDNFTSTCDWLNRNSTVLGESLSCHHLERIVDTLTSLLRSPNLVSKDSRMIVTDWLIDLSSPLSLAVRSFLGVSHCRKLLDSLKDAVHYSPESISQLSGLRSILEEAFGDAARTSLDAIKLRLAIESSHDDDRRSSLWVHLSTETLVESYIRVESLSDSPPLIVPSSAHEFEILTNFLLKRILPIETANPENDDDKESWLVPPSSALSDLPRFWRQRMMGGVVYAIEQRMTTHLGKPRETLGALQAEVNRLFKQTNMQKKDEKDDSSLLPHEEWFRVRCLLEFIDILDRLIYSAHTGSMMTPFNFSAAARSWFKTNEGVCTEWFNRLYPSAMGVAYHASAYSQVIRFGESALSELEKKFVGIPADQPPRLLCVILCWMVRALVEKGDPHTIKGLRSWVRTHFSPTNWEWMECAENAASGRFETAIGLTETEFMKGDPIQEDAKLCLQHVILSSSMKLRRVAHDFDKSLVNEEEMERCLQLTSFAKVEDMNDKEEAAIWNLDKGLMKTEAWLMSTIKKSELSDMREKLRIEGTTALLMDDDGTLTGRYSSLCEIARDVAMKMEKNQSRPINNPYSVICSLSRRSIPRVESFSLSRQREGWVGRLGVIGGGGTHRIKAIHKLTKMAFKLDNMKVMGELEKSIESSDVITKLHFGEIMCEYAKRRGDSLQEPMREEYYTERLVPLLSEAYHVYSAMVMDSSMGGVDSSSSSSNGETAAWAEAIATTTMKMGRLMEKGEMIETDGVSKFHFMIESRRRDTGLDDKGVLLHLSTALNPREAKTRFELGMHTLNMVQKDENPDAIQTILDDHLGPSQSLKIVNAMMASSNVNELARRVKEAIGVEMRTIDRTMGTEGILPSLWQQFYTRRSVLLSNAVMELFAFLNNNGAETGNVRVSTASLHIIHILTRYSSLHPELIPQITEGIVLADERVWAGILPQLFARLAHPIEGVRQAIVAALIKLSRSYPHSTVFQLVVGARSREIREDDRDEEEKESTRIPSMNQSDVVYHRCCSTLVADLHSLFPRLIDDTRMFVDELHQLNMMEEKWCFVLHHLDMDMNKRLNLIRKETEKTRGIERLQENDKQILVAAKTDLIIGPIYRILRDFWCRSLSKANRRVEDAVRFVQTNREAVERAFEESDEARKRGDETARWEAFVRLNVTLGRRSSKKGGQMVDISHCISKLVERAGEWSVPIPGQEASPEAEVVYLVRVESTCQVLSTKTRPKKIYMRGSDGKDRPFLFKAHEDLRLDERVMQLLQMSNLMMKKIGKRDWPLYTARTYAVTPLGPLIGLIQWVNGAVPLYTFYRKWQMRENAKVVAGKKASDGVSLKPLELFEKKMKDLLMANKLDVKMFGDRKSWPPELMRTLFDELCGETSKDLISREMWSRSTSSAHWSKSVRRFTRSTAVMSMIGSILGLGDRHPDNLLIDLSNFHAIHIDYNVCFDRGRKLRVPETVPFRLTQNIRAAFGITGTDGLFTSSCVSVLSSLRLHHSFFSLLLHPFVFDPLMDWTLKDSLGNSVQQAVTHIVYGNDGRAEQKGMTASTLFMIKMKENEGVLEKMSSEAMDFLETMYCGGGGEVTEMSDPLSRWIDIVDDLLWIIRKEEGEHEFLWEERREVAKCKEAVAWSGRNAENGAATPVQKLIHIIPKVMEKLIGMNEECQRRNKSPRSLGLPPGLEEMVYKEEENGVGMSIVSRVVRRLKGEIGGTETMEIIKPEEQATQLIRSASSRMNNAMMYEGWIGWV
ncbi:hypothetical protein PFISCL1PPCAC_19548, partial [Pristionchus fissidentatus]